MSKERINRRLKPLWSKAAVACPAACAAASAATRLVRRTAWFEVILTVRAGSRSRRCRRCVPGAVGNRCAL